MWFWNQSETCPHEPGTIVFRACEGSEIEGLKRLDLDSIKGRIASAFPGFAGNMYYEGSFYFTIDLYHPYVFQIVSSPPENDRIIAILNRIIDIAAESGCILYDPQSGERYS